MRQQSRSFDPNGIIRRSPGVPLPRVAGLATMLCLCLAALSGCYLLQESERYYGVQTAGENLVFVMDVSGSMEGKDEGSIQDQLRGQAAEKAGDTLADAVGGAIGNFLGGQLTSEATKLGSAKRELIPAIRGLDPSSRFAIIIFGENVRTWQTNMIAANATNKNLATAYIKNLSASGGTPAMAALEQAFGFSAAQTLFVATDGQPTDASTSSILERIARMNAGRGMIIHTVGLGDDQDGRFLSALAQRNGGRYSRK